MESALSVLPALIYIPFFIALILIIRYINKSIPINITRNLHPLSIYKITPVYTSTKTLVDEDFKYILEPKDIRNLRIIAMHYTTTTKLINNQEAMALAVTLETLSGQLT